MSDILERRLLTLEERLTQLAQESATHGAVCLERQKTIFNMLASLESQISKLDDKIDKMGNDQAGRVVDMHTRIDAIRTSTNKRLDGWLTAIAGAGIFSTASLTILILTRGLH